MPKSDTTKYTKTGHRRVRRGNAEDAAHLKATLIMAAHDLFANGGLNAVTMRNLASRAEVAAMTPYNYFSSKADLLWHLKNDILRVMLDDQKAAVISCSSAREKLWVSTRDYMRYWLSKPEQYRLMYLPMSLDGDEILTNHHVSDETSLMRDFQIQLVKEFAIETGGNPDYALLTSNFRHAAVLGIIHLHFVNPALMGDMNTAADAFSTLVVDSVEKILKKQMTNEEVLRLTPRAPMN